MRLKHITEKYHQTTYTSGQSMANSLTPAALKPRSREAAAILESFPLLNFMQSQALMIPENKNGH